MPARIGPIARSFPNCLAKLSAMAFTDDDGANWTISQGSGINSGVDHQTVGGGPYARNVDGTLEGRRNPASRPERTDLSKRRLLRFAGHRSGGDRAQ